MEDGYLYNWIFHYNHHMDRWFAFHRDDYKLYFNEFPPYALKANKIDVLIEILKNAKGSKEEIKKLVDGRDFH